MNKLDNIIATRKLERSDGGEVLVAISAPCPDGEDYRCDYEIAGIGSVKRSYAYGVDSVQALVLALQKIGAFLYTSDEWSGGRLSWQGGAVEGDLGFPVPDIIRDIPPSA